MKILKTLFVLAFVVVIPFQLQSDQRVIKYDQNEKSLEHRWDWAAKQVKSIQSDFWVGYSFKRSGSGRISSGDPWQSNANRLTLEELIQEKYRDSELRDESVQDAARSAQETYENRENPYKKSVHHVALLFRFEDGRREWSHLTDMKMSDMDELVDLKKKPLVWLGKADQEESMQFVSQLYDRIAHEEAREMLIAAAGFHETESSLDFLKSVVQSDASDKLRGDAVFWLGQSNDDTVLPLLDDLIQKDRSSEVKEKAVFALHLLGSEAATDILIDLARHAGNRELQNKAIFWLSQQASDRAAETLKDIVVKSAESEIQESAIFAISQLKDDESIPTLIDIAKNHQNLEVRKKAIFWLGQSGDPRAREAIIDIVNDH
jgi:hypothetical protein